MWLLTLVLFSVLEIIACGAFASAPGEVRVGRLESPRFGFVDNFRHELRATGTAHLRDNWGCPYAVTTTFGDLMKDGVFFRVGSFRFDKSYYGYPALLSANGNGTWYMTVNGSPYATGWNCALDTPMYCSNWYTSDFTPLYPTITCYDEPPDDAGRSCGKAIDVYPTTSATMFPINSRNGGACNWSTKGQWYRVIASQASVIVDTCSQSTTYDTVIAVYETCNTLKSCYYFNDDHNPVPSSSSYSDYGQSGTSCPMYSSRLHVAMPASGYLYFFVSSYYMVTAPTDTATVNFEASMLPGDAPWATAPPPTPPPPTPPPPTPSRSPSVSPSRSATATTSPTPRTVTVTTTASPTASRTPTVTTSVTPTRTPPPSPPPGTAAPPTPPPGTAAPPTPPPTPPPASSSPSPSNSPWWTGTAAPPPTPQGPPLPPTPPPSSLSDPGQSCQAAIELTLAYNVSGYFGPAVPARPENECYRYTYGVWFTVTLPRNGVYFITTCVPGMTTDTVIAIYPGCGDADQCAAFNDDVGYFWQGCPYFNLASVVAFTADAGTTLKVFVQNYINNGQGQGYFSVYAQACPILCNMCLLTENAWGTCYQCADNAEWNGFNCVCKSGYYSNFDKECLPTGGGVSQSATGTLSHLASPSNTRSFSRSRSPGTRTASGTPGKSISGSASVTRTISDTPSQSPEPLSVDVPNAIQSQGDSLRATPARTAVVAAGSVGAVVAVVFAIVLMYFCLKNRGRKKAVVEPTQNEVMMESMVVVVNDADSPHARGGTPLELSMGSTSVWQDSTVKKDPPLIAAPFGQPSTPTKDDSRVRSPSQPFGSLGQKVSSPQVAGVDIRSPSVLPGRPTSPVQGQPPSGFIPGTSNGSFNTSNGLLNMSGGLTTLLSTSPGQSSAGTFVTANGSGGFLPPAPPNPAAPYATGPLMPASADALPAGWTGAFPPPPGGAYPVQGVAFTSMPPGPLRTSSDKDVSVGAFTSAGVIPSGLGGSGPMRPFFGATGTLGASPSTGSLGKGVGVGSPGGPPPATGAPNASPPATALGVGGVAGPLPKGFDDALHSAGSIYGEFASREIIAAALRENSGVAPTFAKDVDALLAQVGPLGPNAASAVAVLVHSPEGRAALARAGGIEPMLSLLGHGTETGRERGARLVQKLASEGFGPALVEAGVIDPLLDMMCRIGATEVSIVEAVHAFMELLKGRYHIALAEKRVVQPIVEVVRSGPPAAREFAVEAIRLVCSIKEGQRAVEHERGQELLLSLWNSGGQVGVLAGGALIALEGRQPYSAPPAR